jgi:hypothetical protein
LATYDAYPPYLKRLVCGLRHIYVVRTGLPTGASGLAKPAIPPDAFSLPKLADSKSFSFEVMLAQDLFDQSAKQPLGVRDFLQWKERKFFGTTVPFGTADDDATRILVHAELREESSWLDYVLTHELGHVVEMSMDLNRPWVRLPWETDHGRWVRKFPTAYEMVAGKVFTLANADFLYGQLERGNTATLYGSSDSHEDFAESFTLYSLERDRGFRLSIQRPNSDKAHQLDLIQHLHEPQMEPKLALLERTILDLEKKADSQLATEAPKR